MKVGPQNLFGSKLWQQIGKAVVAELEEAQAGTGDVLKQVGEWSRHLAGNALGRWRTPAGTGFPQCACYDQMTRERCRAAAPVVCDCCGGRACLAHARIDYTAAGMCDTCIMRARLAAQKEQWAPWQAPPGSGPAGAPTGDAAVVEAFRVLKLKRTATLAEVKKAYKKLASEHSPDRPQTDKQREKNVERMKQINGAMAVLRAHFEGKRPS